MYVCTYVYTHVCMYVCMYVCVCMYEYLICPVRTAEVPPPLGNIYFLTLSITHQNVAVREAHRRRLMGQCTEEDT
jgi:hypothetical protein